MKAVTVVGASLAGLAAARALREQGYTGALTVVGAERHAPYDRPPLSKDFLLGKAEAADLALTAEDDSDLDVRWRLGARAVALEPRRRAVVLADGTEVASDAVVVATGAAALPLPGAPRLAGVHTLRTLDDAEALRAELASGSPRVAVVGGSFIGAEIASACAALGLETTVVEAAAAPLEHVLGPEVAAAVAGLHAANGVRLLCGTPVAALAGADRVTGLVLADGRTVLADVVVVGIGARPATDWLTGSGLELDRGVVCDPGLRTALPGVVAVGDAARVRRADGTTTRAEHWSAANDQPPVAVRNLLAGRTVAAYARVPYFWSDQYGRRLQFAGETRPGDTLRVVDGALAESAFAAVYERGGRAVAAVALDRPRAFTRLRKGLAAA
ncbi:NAD(P)/FAD-dependent oxidoreductase [Streptomonospora nanhaiensis]|uniref:3-phenylpropionate/trans-cinnamate dioxygenase ferredoxin reductase subunit n=1 Tax=Streptomonospora nanhaiensis TaxID=1323731 RepID=A0A853BSJ4_9ACTN|nr:FAD-dependent oxidoreductase [Streptomonospora nanhaiensis]MBV2363693.1 FAD-dependent oxidoreductase [Streptomonospora nanhaiensis]MBX9387717.1 FAD-dependent oxidoreductase [Streptomonospora nanhaiensis]NYI98739.1 3-phenylpropionate/trans-cinnamate dioxygenase ferredoxin reductase subunit [Streptomonospora nanhaiensis]